MESLNQGQGDPVSHHDDKFNWNEFLSKFSSTKPRWCDIVDNEEEEQPQDLRIVYGNEPLENNHNDTCNCSANISPSEVNSTTDNNTSPPGQIQKASCKHWEKGNCKLGSKCLFEHDLDEFGSTKGQVSVSRARRRIFKKEIIERINLQKEQQQAKRTGDGNKPLNKSASEFQSGDSNENLDLVPSKSLNYNRSLTTVTNSVPDSNSATDSKSLAVDSEIPSCRHWERGCCREGSNCMFRHDNDLLGKTANEPSREDKRRLLRHASRINKRKFKGK